MSHFYMQVITTAMPTTGAGEAELEALLAPFSENLETEPYDVPCNCAAHQVHVAKQTASDAKFPTWDELRKLFHTDPLVGELGREDFERNWREFTLGKRTFEEEFMADHLPNAKPEPACEECKGTGTTQSTYPPKAKWDWYSVGGRYTGRLSGYDVEKDERNYEKCFCCQGTGRRNDAIALQYRAANPEYKCNGCNGAGKSLKFPSYWVSEGNHAPLDSVLAMLEADPAKTPFGILTPEGEWIERGSMGWGGMVSDEKQKASWSEEVLKLYAKFVGRGLYVTVVDCHI